MFGICKYCKTDNTDISWCRSCDPVNSVCAGIYEVDKLIESILCSENHYNKIELHHKYSSIKLYGLTRDLETKNFMMVLKFADSGNLQQYLTLNFEQLDWKKKLVFLQKIAHELILIHKKEVVHRDFHIGNILIFSDFEPCISDWGLCASSAVYFEVDRPFSWLEKPKVTFRFTTCVRSGLTQVS
ncbi:9288_t:CDS:2 [Dentiscutata erythropus]|uniref:9288_t:CDS:1 n=1 Tax=Dentiscutata erythropus TaxID=1348616 RepID=A0A9N9AGN1_9GLOM|nr:9288_t:CDS:2 [Dentiscutata erythropus]